MQHLRQLAIIVPFNIEAADKADYLVAMEDKNLLVVVERDTLVVWDKASLANPVEEGSMVEDLEVKSVLLDFHLFHQN